MVRGLDFCRAGGMQWKSVLSVPLLLLLLLQLLLHRRLRLASTAPSMTPNTSSAMSTLSPAPAARVANEMAAGAGSCILLRHDPPSMKRESIRVVRRGLFGHGIGAIW